MACGADARPRSAREVTTGGRTACKGGETTAGLKRETQLLKRRDATPPGFEHPASPRGRSSKATSCDHGDVHRGSPGGAPASVAQRATARRPTLFVARGPGSAHVRGVAGQHALARDDARRQLEGFNSAVYDRGERRHEPAPMRQPVLPPVSTVRTEHSQRTAAHALAPTARRRSRVVRGADRGLHPQGQNSGCTLRKRPQRVEATGAELASTRDRLGLSGPSPPRLRVRIAGRRRCGVGYVTILPRLARRPVIDGVIRSSATVSSLATPRPGPSSSPAPCPCRRTSGCASLRRSRSCRCCPWSRWRCCARRTTCRAGGRRRRTS